MSRSILVADDDPEIRDVVRIYLKNEGYRVLEAEDGAQALDFVRRESVDLVILDVMMPVMDGIKACLKIEVSAVPIIMLSAKGEDLDKINGLTTGADDYVTKPFNPLELTARVKSTAPQADAHDFEKAQDGAVIEIGDLVIDRKRHSVTVRGRDIALTPLEFSILELMASHRGHVFNVERIYQSVWKEDKFTSDNTVMVHIRNIREKVEDNPREPQYIKTVWGVGYKVE